MAETRTRLRRLLAETLEECCEADVDRRLEELHALTDATFDEDLVRPVFAVLGNRTRYRLARTLAVTDDERCVCELEPVVDVSESAVSHALSDLVDAGLATRRKAGNWRYYDATPLAESLFETADREVGASE
ncbi:ArsR/SmtB family transcription factor [Natronobeatus ordinarius]|uniref:ArsR/SmtB family transcription factor n=1 Tax=Natronobeatus ordinarius TaxID=2963433 RepID=UPI0020CFBBB6|nr:metalloregulator ArsR/SmtB family transcription factor [Natronobeatus ordinarius]